MAIHAYTANKAKIRGRSVCSEEIMATIQRYVDPVEKGVSGRLPETGPKTRAGLMAIVGAGLLASLALVLIWLLTQNSFGQRHLTVPFGNEHVVYSHPSSMEVKNHSHGDMPVLPGFDVNKARPLQ